MGRLRVLIRSLRLLAHLGSGLLLAVLLLIEGGHRLDRLQLARWWSRRLLRILNLRVTLRGTPISGARMTVANHVSWLDIPLISACEPTQFIAKSEIRDWPIAGTLANACGTFYIRRGKGGARPLLDRLDVHLRQGGAVTLFPEGTTTDGRRLLTFHGRLFAAAIESACPVQPVALRYRPDAQGHDIAPFIGDDDLVSHVLRVLRAPSIDVEVSYCTPIDAQGRDRDELAAAAREAIAAELFGASAQREPLSLAA